jgi:hypothetical protein
MNTSRLAHISISIFHHCRSLLFSVDAASYFLVGRHRLSFLCARDREFRKNIKKEKETTHFFPYVCLRLVSWSGEHTYTVFFLVSRRISSERTKKLGDEECVCVHTHTKKKKKEGYTPESRMAVVVLGLKKARGEREEEIEPASSR